MWTHICLSHSVSVLISHCLGFAQTIGTQTLDLSANAFREAAIITAHKGRKCFPTVIYSQNAGINRLSVTEETGKL